MSDNGTFPPIVYKYRSWQDPYHRAMLQDNELYLSSPADFNDPFDCRIPVNYLLLDSPDKITQYVEDFIARDIEQILANGMDVARLRNMMTDRLMNHREEMQKESQTEEFARMDIHYGVLSLSARWDSILMWSHYADKHRGYCIGFEEPSLQQAGIFGRGGMVMNNEHDDAYPEVDPRDQNVMRKAFLQTHYKAWEWDYEKEYRLTKLFFDKAPTVEDRKCHVPDDFIAEVLIGLKTSEADTDEIIGFAVQKNIPVYQTIQVPVRFKMDRIQIA